MWTNRQTNMLDTLLCPPTGVEYKAAKDGLLQWALLAANH